MSGPCGIVVAGLRGQPVRATADLLARAALRAGLDAAVAEAPGSPLATAPCEVHVRVGAEVLAAQLLPGAAEVLVAFDQLEALRAARLLAPGAFVALDDRVAPTWRMRAGLEPLPADAAARLASAGARVVAIDADAQLRRGDGAETVGLVLLGLVSPLLPVPVDAFLAALAEDGPAQAEARRGAFLRGRALHASLAPSPALTAVAGGAPAEAPPVTVDAAPARALRVVEG